MDMMLGVLLVAPLLACVAYVYYRLPIHTRSASATWFLRLLLAAVGFGLGAVLASRWGYLGYPHKWLAFLGGFGLAHLPAAVILFIKRRRFEYG